MSEFLECLMDFYQTNDLYAVLGVKKTASKKEMDTAFRILSLRTHPDRAKRDRASQMLATKKFQVQILSVI